MPYPYSSDRQEIVSRLRKIEGQVRGVQRMVEDDKDCVDVLTQISAVVSGMRKVGLKVLGSHMGRALDGKRDQGEIDRVLAAVERFLQT